MSIFEILMLTCFASAWPANIYKGLKSKSINGKSIKFSFIILAGYVFGVFHKMIYNMDPVFYLYIINFVLILVDIAVYYRNKRLFA